MFRSMTALKKANRAAGQQFFSTATMRMWASKVETPLVLGRYFVTSEQPPESTARVFTVRSANSDATIETVGEFGQYPSKAAALQALIEKDASSHLPACRDCGRTVARHDHVRCQACTDRLVRGLR